MDSFDRLKDFIRSWNLDVPLDCDLVLDVEKRMEDGQRYRCEYYYVCHSTRTVFWLENANITELFRNTGKEVTQSRIRKFGSPHIFLC
jgi:hypothetical protein